MTHTPIRPSAGGKVHAVALRSEDVGVTVCRRKFNGWVVVDAAIDCRRCCQLIANGET